MAMVGNVENMTKAATRKRASFGTSMGVSSIIAILVILVLVVFSALSITTSKADLKLSQKTSDGVIAFFEADAAAEDKMAEAAAAIAAGGNWQASLRGLGCEVSSVSGGTLINKNGKDAGPGAFRTRDQWETLLKFNEAGSYTGTAPWDFSSLPAKGYPILVGVPGQ